MWVNPHESWEVLKWWRVPEGEGKPGDNQKQFKGISGQLPKELLEERDLEFLGPAIF